MFKKLFVVILSYGLGSTQISLSSEYKNPTDLSALKERNEIAYGVMSDSLYEELKRGGTTLNTSLQQLNKEYEDHPQAFLPTKPVDEHVCDSIAKSRIIAHLLAQLEQAEIEKQALLLKLQNQNKS